jgi:hypothetical protein
LLAPTEQFEEIASLRDLSQPALPQIRHVADLRQRRLREISERGDLLELLGRCKQGAGEPEIVDGMLVDRARMLMLSLASISYEIYDREDRTELRLIRERVYQGREKVLGEEAFDGEPLAGIGAEPAVNGMLVDRARMLMLSLASISYEIYDREDRTELRHDPSTISSGPAFALGTKTLSAEGEPSMLRICGNAG